MGCRRSSGGSRLGVGIHGEGLDGRSVGNGEALWQGHEDVGAVGRSACAGSEARESIEGWLQGRGDAHPVHSMAQNLFQDVMAQRKLCSQGGASHAMVGVREV
jgi:hypothetical protein